MKSEIEAIEGGEIVRVSLDAPEPPSTRIEAISLAFAGPCDRARAALVHRWGKPSGQASIDERAHRRASLALDTCELRVESYADLDAWISNANSSLIPLGAIGTSAAIIAKRVGARRSPGQLSWTVPGIGRARGGVVVTAMVEHGRVTSLVATGTSDPETLAHLRARLTELRGPPRDDDASAARRGGKPAVALAIRDHGSFELSIED